MWNAIEGGHLPIVQHLIDTYPYIRKKEAYPDYKQLALNYRHLHIAQWLETLFLLSS
jgi:hypothetical protein